MEPTEFVMVMPIITAIELASQLLMAMLAMLAPKSMPMQLAAPTLVVEPMAIIIMVALAFAMHFHLHRK